MKELINNTLQVIANKNNNIFNRENSLFSQKNKEDKDVKIRYIDSNLQAYLGQLNHEEKKIKFEIIYELLKKDYDVEDMCKVIDSLNKLQ